MSAIRKITADMPLDDDEDEVFFTRATIKADPNAADLLPMTDDWLGLIDAARAKDRQARIAETDATAARVVSNFHFDRACTAFGDDLYLAVGKNRESPRWTQFFSVAVSRFIKIRFDKQVQKVKSWLGPDVNDATLDKHRTPLTTWSNAAAASIDQTTSAAMVRGAARIAREQLAEDLTRERDGLYDALSARAREKGLPRDWPKQFFRVTTRKTASGGDDDGEDVEQSGSGT
ncbi:MAG: hypothetical protein IPM54_42150 [Polyangiaceae bacterium]|nr:hypothetical protein [Polyangiaceae bacterium]